MNSVKLRLSRDEILRLIFLKKEIKKNLLKSILRNQSIKSNIRIYSTYKIQCLNTYYSRQKNYCIVTSKSGGVLKLTNTSRQVLNKLLQEGFVTNIKTNNVK